jgi:hypothetical protein
MGEFGPMPSAERGRLRTASPCGHYETRILPSPLRRSRVNRPFCPGGVPRFSESFDAQYRRHAKMTEFGRSDDPGEEIKLFTGNFLAESVFGDVCHLECNSNSEQQ